MNPVKARKGVNTYTSDRNIRRGSHDVENLGGYFYEVSEVQLQLLGKLLDGDDVQFRPVNVFEFPSQSIPCDTDCDWAEPATGSWCQERCVS